MKPYTWKPRLRAHIRKSGLFVLHRIWTFLISPWQSVYTVSARWSCSNIHRPPCQHFLKEQDRIYPSGCWGPGRRPVSKIHIEHFHRPFSSGLEAVVWCPKFTACDFGLCGGEGTVAEYCECQEDCRLILTEDKLQNVGLHRKYGRRGHADWMSPPQKKWKNGMKKNREKLPYCTVRVRILRTTIEFLKVLFELLRQQSVKLLGLLESISSMLSN